MDRQLQLDLENSDSDIQQQIDHISDSLAKSRKRLFAEIGEVKKMCQSLKEENELLRAQLHQIKREKNNWSYTQDDFLFCLSEAARVG